MYWLFGPVFCVSVGVKGPVAPGSLTGGSTPVDTDEPLMASALSAASALAPGPESGSGPMDVLGPFGEFPAVPPEDEAAPPPELPELPPELDPELELAPELPAPAWAPEP